MPVPALSLAALAALLALGACSPDALPAGPRALFAVRGRLARPERITWRVESDAGPLPVAELERAVARAAEIWSDAGSVRFEQASEGAEADLTLGWRAGEHDLCPAFGISSAVAHSGPLPPPTFTHLDRARPWRADLDEGAVLAGEESAVQIAVHELGHLLGLDHTPDPESVMFPDARGVALSPSDRAGLASLYGGETDAASDLALLATRRDGDADERAIATFLRRVAPPGTSDAALVDVDQDGAREVVVWSTDGSAQGALVAFHFAPVASDDAEHAPRLARTTGPVLGVVPVGAERVELREREGRAELVVYGPGGLAVRWGFDARGLPVVLQADEPGAAPGAAALDPDERVRALPTLATSAALTGDLDGDGQDELVRRVLPSR